MSDDTKSGDEAEQRLDKRFTINKEFSSFDAFVEEYVTNISLSGVFIRSRDPLPIGTKVNLVFTVLMDGIETVEGVGEVVRVHSDADDRMATGMGVVFTELSKTSQAIITRLLTSRPGSSKAQ